MRDPDAEIRAAAFAALTEIERRHGWAVPASVIARGFSLEGRRIPFRSQQGIFRPKAMRGAALSISTVIPSSGPPRYDDEIGGDDDSFVYRYRDNGVDSFDNQILRLAFEMQAPVIYFRGIVPGVYAALFPCFVTEDHPAQGFVRVEATVAAIDLSAPLAAGDPIERRYAIREVKQRLHRQRFRQMVMRAYASRCTICRLREVRLLQAAHIVPDRDRRGEAIVPNGLSLCSIHHGAFDHNLLAVTPDYEVRLSRRLLEDQDGPMLEQGLKAFHRRRIHLPRNRSDHPSKDALEERLAEFDRVA